MSKTQWGLVAMVASFAVWGAIFALPFLDLEPRTKWLLGVVIYGISYAFFFLSIGLLGKERYHALKARVLGFFRRKREG